MLPEVLINEILFIANIHCHSCLKEICYNKIKIIKKQGKYYYCDKKCYITV